MNGNNSDLYSFAGTAGQQVAVAMESAGVFTRIELLDPQGAVIAGSGSVFQRSGAAAGFGVFHVAVERDLYD